jgi:RNA polymerase sigma-70 factor (ECF subfamily)
MDGENGQPRSPAGDRGDRAALDALWREHRRWVAAVLLAYMPRDAELEDLMQEVAVTLVARIGELREPDRLRPWLRAIAVNTARMAGRARRVRRRVLRPLDEGDGHLSDPAVERAALAADAQAEADTALRLARELPEDYREPLLLRSLRGLSQKEIAAVLDLPVTTVETRLARARRLLRRQMEDLAAPRAALAPHVATTSKPSLP